MAKKKINATAALDEAHIQEIAAETAVQFLAGLPEVQEAGLTTADIQLAIEDRGWIGGATFSKIGGEMDARSRNLTVTQCRGYWLRDPLAHQAVRLWTDYSFGDTGMSVSSDDEASLAKVTTFIDDRRNKNLMSAAGQKRLSNKLLVDGDIFFAMFDDGTIRTFDPLQITLITDPDDEETTLAYKRLTASSKTLYYIDWAANRADVLAVEDPETHKTFKPQKGVSIYHAKYDAFGRRGNGLLIASMFWSREHRRFMENRVALTAALAKFAFNLTVKGGPKKVLEAKAQIESSFASRGSAGAERNPPSAPGSTYIGNEAAVMTPMPRTTGASEARDDAEGLKLMVCAGTGIMSHYFGDPSTGNLATATAMELPMLKQFQGYQKLWKDIYRDLFSILLQEKANDELIQIDVDMPPILDDDLTALGGFLSQLSTIFPEVKVPEILQMCLISLGINNVEELMERIEEKRLEIEQQQEEIRALGMGAAPVDPEQQKLLTESYVGLKKAILILSGKL